MTDPTILPRLLRGASGTPLSLAEHEALFPHTSRSTSLLDELDASGLTGRGGAAFSTAAKARLLRSQKGQLKSVVVNAMEGEPASHKDATMLSSNPHLVLDGAEALGSIIGSQDVIICVADDQPARASNTCNARSTSACVAEDEAPASSSRRRPGATSAARSRPSRTG